MSTAQSTATSRQFSSQSPTVVQMDAALGAEVRCADVKKLDRPTTDKVRAALLDHLVILIRGQNLSNEEFLDFASKFGDLGKSAPRPVGQGERPHPSLGIISNVKVNGKLIGSLGDGEAVWHTDSNFFEVPPAASFLHSLEIPPVGGNTSFTNMYLALEELPGHLRSAIKGRTIKHDQRFSSDGLIRPGYDPDQDIRESPGVSHHIVRTHPETGKNTLYLGRRPHAYINGLPLEESESLLNELWAHGVRPEYAWEHVWRVGDILVWDNRCTMHRRDAFDPASRRIMLRTQVVGNRITEPEADTPAHPRGMMLRQSAGAAAR